MLSVLSTPWTKPAAIHSAPSARHGADDAVVEGGDRVGRVGGVGPVVGDRMVDEAAERVGLAERGEALEGADADVAVAEPDQHRRAGRRGLVAAPSASPVSISEKVFEVSTPSASSISVARISRTPPLSVSRPSPTRDQGVWPEPLVPRSSRRPSASRGAGRTGSRGRRRGRDCTRGTGGRGSAAPAARGGCRAAARSGRNGAIQSASSRPSRPTRAAQRSLRKRSRVSGKSAGRTGS